MTALELYKFCTDPDGLEPEMRWEMNDTQLLTWIHPSWLKTFVDLLDDDIFDDGGIDVTLVHWGYVVINLVPICEYYDIDPEDILKKETKSRG